MKRFYLSSTLLFLLCCTLQAQEIRYRLEAAATTASEKTPPTWHLSNRQGITGDVARYGYLRAGIEGENKLVKNFDLNWGVDIIAGNHLTSSVYIQQAFADINWKMFTGRNVLARMWSLLI